MERTQVEIILVYVDGTYPHKNFSHTNTHTHTKADSSLSQMSSLRMV
jgi:hypothetical protein